MNIQYTKSADYNAAMYILREAELIEKGKVSVTEKGLINLMQMVLKGEELEVPHYNGRTTYFIKHNKIYRFIAP